VAGIDGFFERVASLRRAGEAFAVATVVSRRAPVSSHLGDRALIFEDGVMEGFVGGSCSREIVRAQALDALATGQPRLVSIRPADGAVAGVDVMADGIVVPMSCGSKGSVDVYVEPFMRARTVVVVGLTPVAEALAQLATTLEYRVVRVVAAEEQRDLPTALTLEELPGLLLEIGPAARTSLAVVVASQGHYDEAAIPVALDAGASISVRGTTVRSLCRSWPRSSSTIRRRACSALTRQWPRRPRRPSRSTPSAAWRSPW
jgi:xanthine dehydrogenase accessory factor